LPPDKLCCHGKGRNGCKACGLDRQNKRDRDAVVKNELEYFFEREVKRTFQHLQGRHPEKLEKMQQELEKQGIEELAVVDLVAEDGDFLSRVVVFEPTE